MYTPPESTPASPLTVAAIVVAGGAGSRLGGVNKPLLTTPDGVTLLNHALRDLHTVFADQLADIAVVGPTSLNQEVASWPNVLRVQENPPLSGPAAAVVAGTQALAARNATKQTPPDVVVLLAADFVAPRAGLEFLKQALTEHSTAELLVPRDEDGHPQWLLSAVSWPYLAERVAEGAEQSAGQSLRWLLDAPSATFVKMTAHAQNGTRDVDSPADAQRYEIRLPSTQNSTHD